MQKTSSSQVISVVLTTFPDEQTAQNTIRQLVESKLIACGTLLPKATSIYMWQQKIVEESEVFCILKTQKNLTRELIEKLSATHPYECPEILAMNTTDGLSQYIDWIHSSTK